MNSPTLEEAKKISDPGERIRFLADADDWVGKFAWRVLSQSFVYAAHRIGEICRSPLEIDRALRWGYNWEIGLFEIWDAMGVERTVRRLEKDGLAVPNPVHAMLRAGRKSFYEPLASPPTVFELSTGTIAWTEDPIKTVNIPVIKKLHGRIEGNDDASLIDIGDGVRCLEFHTKMNTLGPGVVEMLERALDRSDADGAPLVIGGPAANFSAGANLQRLLDLARKKDWKSLDRRLQSAVVRLQRSALPVVAAPAGLALGGGAEIVLRSPRVQAYRETSMGLVELRVGLIPGAGGTTEMLKRALGTAADPVDAWPLVKGVFDLIRDSRVSTAAEEATRMGFLKPTDRISVSRLRHLEDAKLAAIELASEGPPRVFGEPQVLCLGADALARLKVGLHLAREGGYITDYDVVVGGKLAWILCGGDLVAPKVMPEQYLLDLEREAFLSLLGDDRTQARMEHLLKTGKPLRN
ncbi:MAG: enoyl-CoA hydratase/isomerase family protein [Planctomycetota bacterium]